MLLAIIPNTGRYVSSYVYKYDQQLKTPAVFFVCEFSNLGSMILRGFFFKKMNVGHHFHFTADETLRIWDSSGPPNSTAQIHAHNGEVLTCDWSKYDPNLICTGGVDRTVRCWDLRQSSFPLATLEGHTQAVKRVKCDPFKSGRLASCSYDFTVRLWEIGKPATPLLETIAHHSEFTFGLDLSALEEGKVSVAKAVIFLGYGEQVSLLSCCIIIIVGANPFDTLYVIGYIALSIMMQCLNDLPMTSYMDHIKHARRI